MNLCSFEHITSQPQVSTAIATLKGHSHFCFLDENVAIVSAATVGENQVIK